MDKKIKNIAVSNFKVNADLKVQYIFADGHCYFLRSAANKYAKESGEKYETVERDSEALEASADETSTVAKRKELTEKLDTLMADLLNEVDAEKKAEIETEIEELETELEDLK